MNNSIEYLINEVSEILGKTHLNSMQYLLLTDALKKAREMHKKEIIESYNYSVTNPYTDLYVHKIQGKSPITKGEDYYNKKYNQEQILNQNK